MGKKIVFWGIIILALLALSSYSYYFRKLVLSWFVPEESISYTYTTLRGEFRMNEAVNWKGSSWSWEQVESRFNKYKQCYPTTKDTVLYRTFKKVPWQFWNWLAFITHPRYQLLYVDPKTVPESPSMRPPTLCPGEF